jgi:hypothetical protein
LGGAGQIYNVDNSKIGRVEIGASRFPAQNASGSGEQPLVSLVFRARRKGEAIFEFAPFRRENPVLLDAADSEVAALAVSTSVWTPWSAGFQARRSASLRILLTSGR